VAVSVENSRILIKDLKSVNGTFVKVRSARRLEHGDRLRLGRQTLVFGERGGAALDEGLDARAPKARPTKPTGSVEPDQPGPGDSKLPTATFRASGQTVPVAAGQTVCEAAEAGGVAITAECHSGICGSDPIRILEGAGNLAGEPGDQERETLEELCELEPGPCRLACLCRASGPVKVEIL
jgi:ferredoxin